MLLVLDDPGIAAFQNYVNLGGNFVGIHAASDCLRNNTFFQNELGDYIPTHATLSNQIISGAHFRDHANLQNAVRFLPPPLQSHASNFFFSRPLPSSIPPIPVQTCCRSAGPFKMKCRSLPHQFDRRLIFPFTGITSKATPALWEL